MSKRSAKVATAEEESPRVLDEWQRGMMREAARKASNTRDKTRPIILDVLGEDADRHYKLCYFPVTEDVGYALLERLEIFMTGGPTGKDSTFQSIEHHIKLVDACSNLPCDESAALFEKEFGVRNIGKFASLDGYEWGDDCFPEIERSMLDTFLYYQQCTCFC